jgi:hypothetical protein
MSHNNGITRAPVGIVDAQKAFYNNSDDLATIILNGIYNPNSKYKPVRLYGNDTITGQFDRANNKWLSSATWWKGTDGKCGLDIVTFTSAGSMSNHNSFLYQLKNGELSWHYLRPQGTINQPFRLQDFAENDNGAERAIGTCSVQDGAIVWVDRQGQTLQIDYDAPIDERNLALKDFTIGGVPMSSMYLGLLLWRETGNYVIATAGTTIGLTGSVSINISIDYDMTGNWSFIPFIYYETPNSQTYMSAGITSPINITLKPNTQTIEYFVSAAWDLAGTSVEFYAMVINNLTSTQNISNVTVYIVTTTSPSASPASTGQVVTSINLGNCVVGAQSDYSFAGRTVNITRNTSLTYWIGAGGNGSGVEPSSWQQIEDGEAPLE